MNTTWNCGIGSIPSFGNWAQFHVGSKYLDPKPPIPTLQFGYPPNIYLCPNSTWMSEVANVYFNNMHFVGRLEVFS